MGREHQASARVDAARELTTRYERETGLSAVDELTGLYRHSVFRMLLDAITDAADPDRDLFSVAVLDVDRFDTLNKRLGYAEGDRFLRHAGAACRETLRADDFGGHLRDDAIGVVLRDTAGVDARQVIERVKQAVSEGGASSFTLSAGIASYPASGADTGQLLSRAMGALQEAKLRGQDRIQISEPDPDTVVPDKHTIMVVDDDEQNRKLLGAFLDLPGYTVVEASTADEALRRIHKRDVDLIISDVRMPHMDGYEFCRRVKTSESTRLIPFVLVTAYGEPENRLQGIESGADDFLTKPLDKAELLARTKALLHVRKLNQDFTTIESVLFTLINAIEAKDSYTQGHTERVATLAAEVGRRMGLPQDSVSALKLGGILHDIGKIGISGQVLNKDGPLTDEEWGTMKSHTELGYKICLPLTRNIGKALDIVRHHHEKLDGSSYPDGLSGADLSIETRITAVVDMYDAMTTDRPYRPAMSREKAVQILRDDAASGKIDGDVVSYLERIVHASEDHARRRRDPEDRRARTILIVEDDALNLKLVRTILHLEGYRVLEAADAESGIQIARDEPLDLILMDLQLPGMDGITAARIIRNREGFERVPIVAISSYAMRDDVENAMDAGFVDYITKPIDTATFPELIAQHLNGDHTRQ